MTEPGPRDPWGVVPQRLRPPNSRHDSLERSELVARLCAAQVGCVVLRAGAGYGKTTLLRQWADADGRRVAWVSLDPADNDPVVLMRHLVRSLGSSGVSVEVVEEMLASREPQMTLHVLPALARSLEDEPGPFLLVLDDLHLVTDRESVALLGQLLAMVPRGSTMALAGRAAPPLRMARRLLDGNAMELGPEELAFTESEAAALVRHTLPELSVSLSAELVRCTERWPAGLYLGVLALTEHPDPPVLLRGLLASDRRILEYLHEEVLGAVEPEVRQFLLRAALLEHLTGGLCDAALQREDSQSILERLSSSGNLFVSGVDGAPDSFRLHGIFADLLVTELRRTDPEAVADVQRRAAVWHDEHGESDAAVRVALASGDAALASAMLYRQLFGALVRGETASLDRWVDAFPPQQVRTDGLVALCAGWAAVSRGELVDLEHHLANARSTSVPGPLPDGTSSYEVALAALEMTAGLGGVSATARHASTVRAAGPAGSPWSGMAALLEALALGLAGLVDPVRALEAAEIESRGMAAVHAVALAQLGVAQLRAGHTSEGHRNVERAAEEMREFRLEAYSMSVFLHGASSYSAALRGDRAASRGSADAADTVLRAVEPVVPRAQIHVRLLLAEAALLRGDRRVAVAELHQVTALRPAEPDAVLLQGWADDLDGRVERARIRDGAPELTAAELRVLEQLSTHRSLVEIGEHLYVSRNTVKTHTLSIYRKLDVSGRSEAVDRAREHGLIDPAPPGR